MAFYFSLSFAEIVLAYSAKGAYEIFGKILELCAGSNSVVGIAEGFVIFPSAYVAYILFHIDLPPYIS